MTLKKPAGPAHRRQLRTLLDGGALGPASTAALSGMMRGYAPSHGQKPSSGSRRTRAHLSRAGAGGGMGAMYGSLDRMVADMLLKGPMTTGVLGSVFGVTPNLTGR